METKPGQQSGMSEEAALMRQLELLLVPLHHRFRSPLPIPAHLVPRGGNAGVGAALHQYPSSASITGSSISKKPASDPATSTSPCGDVDSEELASAQQTERHRRCAMQVVADQVPELVPWQERLQRGAAQAQHCYQVLDQVRSSVLAMQRVTESVQKQSDHLSHNASAMMMRKAKLELVRDSLEQNLAHFTHIDDLCREAGNPFLKAGTPRFSTLLHDIAKEMDFLSANTQYKSAKPYAMKLAVAQQTVNGILKDAVQASFRTMEVETRASPAFQAATCAVIGAEARASGRNPEDPPGLSSSPPRPPPESTEPSSLTTARASERLELYAHDVGGSFESFLNAVNEEFVRAGDSFTPLRRMVELRHGGFGYCGAEAFGEEMSAPGDRLEADPGMREVMDAYRDARVGVVVPLLRYWLTLWYYLDAQTASPPDMGVTDGVPTATAAAAAAAALSVKQSSSSGVSQLQLSGMMEDHTLPQLAEHICGLLQRSLAAEEKVLVRLWLRADLASHLLPQLVSSIAEEVYHVFRARLLCVDSVGELSRTVEQIQRVRFRSAGDSRDSEMVSELWVRMIQDAQERLVFRTGAYLRQNVARCLPTEEMAALYLRFGSLAYGGDAAIQEDGLTTAMFYIPGLLHALQLLHWIYPTLEFSVFSVFAEEAVHYSLDLVQQLVKLMLQKGLDDPLRDSKAYLCQLAHLQHLQEELSHVDANITVVEKHISFSALRKSRLVLEQSSRESKKEVAVDLLKCSERLTTAMFAVVTQPVSGAAKKGEAERVQLVADMKGRVVGMERMIDFYVKYPEARQDLRHLLHDRTRDLAIEIGVNMDAVEAVQVALPKLSLSNRTASSQQAAKSVTSAVSSAPMGEPDAQLSLSLAADDKPLIVPPTPPQPSCAGKPHEDNASPQLELSHNSHDSFMISDAQPGRKEASPSSATREARSASVSAATAAALGQKQQPSVSSTAQWLHSTPHNTDLI